MFSKKFIAATTQYSMGEKGESFIQGAPLFRRKFSWNGEKAVLTICGLGFYELYINGTKITKGKLAPYISNPNHCVYYDAYELDAYLTPGENVMGVMLGNGFQNSQVACWDFDKASFRGAPKMALALELDGNLAFEADEQFRWTDAPVIYDDLRYGEYYDARLEIPGWCSAEYDDGDWKLPIEAPTPKGEARLCTAEPIRCTRTVKSVAHWKIEQGFVYDFGENVAGVVTLKIQGWPGQKIRYQHGETLLEGKSLYIKNITTPEIKNKYDWQTDIYICKGDPEGETYTPHFTYHGFRYLFVEGISDEQATDDLFTMEVWHSDFSHISSLTTDNAVVNQLQEMTLRSDLSNFLYLVTDCPQREKNGWLGDAGLSAEQMLYNFDCAASHKEWLHNIISAQREDGSIPSICPTGDWGYNLYAGPWTNYTPMELIYQCYRFTGDKSLITDNLAAIKKMLELSVLPKQNEDGMYAYGLPDWCETLSLGENMSSTPLEITDTLFVVSVWKKMAKLCELIGMEAEASQYRQREQALIESFRKKYLTEDLYISAKTQTAQAAALFYGVFRPEEEAQAVENLLTLIREVGYFKVGSAGVRVLFRVLCDRGYQDLALKLMTQNDLPSFKWWINQGMTTLGESINETYPGSSLRTDGSRMLSLNHHFFGDISGVFYRYILGLDVNPNMDNPNEIALKPLTFAQINYAKGTYSRNGNRLTVEVRKNENGQAEAVILENTGFSIL